jgi:hypothetical protein
MYLKFWVHFLYGKSNLGINFYHKYLGAVGYILGDFFNKLIWSSCLITPNLNLILFHMLLDYNVI